IVDDLIDAVIDQGSADLVQDLSYPLPIIVIGEMLGVPPEDRQMLIDAATAIVNYFDFNATGAARDHANDVCARFNDMATRLVEDRRRAPQADMLTALVEAEEAGDKLSREELISMCFVIAGAGHETTANYLSTLVYTLLKDDRALWTRL